MKSLLLAVLLTLVSCGRTHNKSNPIVPVVQNASIFNKFEALDPATALHGITTLDFSSFQLGVQFDATANCTGTQYGNSGDVNGVSEGKAEFSGSDTEGILQYGHLPYLNPLDNLCRDISKESYSYKITGDTLKLCMVNYPFCADYKLVD